MSTFVRDLRRQSTPTEKLLWECLRARKVLGYKFRRQHPLFGFVVDFYCAEKNLIIELDGSVHMLPEVQQRDVSRQQNLEELGYTFLRFTSAEVANHMEQVLARIEACLTPSPSPSDDGEGSTKGLLHEWRREQGEEAKL